MTRWPIGRPRSLDARSIGHTLHSLTVGGSRKNQMLKEKYQEEIDDILSRYPVKRSALIPSAVSGATGRGLCVRGGDEGDRGALASDPATSL